MLLLRSEVCYALQPSHAAKRSRLNEKPATPVAQMVAQPVAQQVAQPPPAEPMQEDVPEGPAHLHISGLPGYLTKEKVITQLQRKRV